MIKVIRTRPNKWAFNMEESQRLFVNNMWIVKSIVVNWQDMRRQMHTNRLYIIIHCRSSVFIATKADKCCLIIARYLLLSIFFFSSIYFFFQSGTNDGFSLPANLEDSLPCVVVCECLFMFMSS